MDFSNSVLIQWGKVSISQQEYSWVQPILSSNGTVGGNSFAVNSGSVYDNREAYYAFDNNTTTLWQGGQGQAASQSVNYLTIYNPTPIKITSLRITNYNAGLFSATNGKVTVSNDGTNFTVLTNFTNSNYTEYATWNIALNNDSYYKYYRIYFWNTGSNLQIQISEIKIIATYKSDVTNIITFPTSYTSTNYSYSIGYLNEENTSYATSKSISGISLFNPQSSSGFANWMTIGY